MMLTAKQKKVLDYISRFEEKNGYVPTLQEVADGLSIKSVSTIHQHVHELIDKDYLFQNGDYGALEINKKPLQNKIPILGEIAAGKPILVTEDNDPDTISVDNLPSHYRDFYALKVRGDSMVDENIFNGDTVIIKRQDYADDGQIVVAVINEEGSEEATLKKIFRKKNGYELRPANQKMLPIFCKDVEVRGIVWEIRRNLGKPVVNKTNKQTKWKTLDLFAGIGGIRKGFEQTGSFQTAFSNDFEAPCKITYDLNFNEAKLVVEDITKIHENTMPEFDFLLAGFPCQAFSIAGYRKGFDDEKGRGNLFFDIARILRARKPEGFLLENVKNLRTHDGGRTFEIIQDTLKILGYHTKTKVLNTMEYGNVPQNRERIYIVGFKDEEKIKNFDFPDKIPLTKKVEDILEKKVDKKYYYNGKPLYERLKEEVNEKGSVYQWRRQYVRKNKSGVCPTLTANMGMGGHNVPLIFDGKGIRKLTPRECARLQGFDDDFKLPENLPDSRLYKQIGNSVSVPVIKRIAENIAKATN